MLVAVRHFVMDSVNMHPIFSLLLLNGVLQNREVASLACGSREALSVVGRIPRRYARQCLDCAKKPVRLVKSRCSSCRRRAFPEMSRTYLLQRGCPETLLQEIPWRKRGSGCMGYNLRDLFQKVAVDGGKIRHLALLRPYRGRVSLKNVTAFLDLLSSCDEDSICRLWDADII